MGIYKGDLMRKQDLENIIKHRFIDQDKLCTCSRCKLKNNCLVPKHFKKYKIEGIQGGYLGLNDAQKITICIGMWAEEIINACSTPKKGGLQID